MKNTKKNPRLRFSEFSEMWKLKTIGEVLTIGSGKDYKNLSVGNIPVYGTGGYMLSVDDYLYDGESVCIGRKGTIDKPTFLSGKFWTVDTLFYTYKFKNSLPKFIYFYFQTINWKNYNEASGVPSLSKTTIEKIDIRIPEIFEQQKIADFLTQIDNRIEKLTKKKQFLEKYKKGVMQKIFNQEIRFKNDNDEDYSNWEERRLGEISNPKQWATISSNDLLDSGYPVYGANSFIGYYSEYNHEFETVTITCRGATCGSVSLIPEKSYITGNSMCLDNIESTIYNYKFIYYSTSFRGFDDVISGSAQPQIIGSAIKKVKIRIPSLPEQTKIVNFLTEIDKKINLTEKQLNGTKQYKKGLLQQMFI